MAVDFSFINRVPLHPGRVTLNPVAGESGKYDMVRSDDPLEEGTPLNADTFNNLVNLISTDIERAKNEAISAGLKCVTGKYSGTGTYGNTNKSSLTFSALPKLLIIVKGGITVGSIAGSTVRVVTMAVMLNMGSSGWGAYGFVTPGTVSERNFIYTIFSGNSVEWYSDETAAVQLNDNYSTYYYVAFC